MAQRQQRGDETFTHKAEFIEEFRFILLGAKKGLMDRACDIILRGRGEPVNSGLFEHRKGRVSRRKISVVKTPSSWMNRLASLFFLSSGVESIKDEMLDCASQVFPGPHAFLLVTDSQQATGKANYLLKEIAKVFSKEALNYVVVLYIGQNNAERVSSIRNVNRFHTLEDTDQSVETLFRHTERMIHKNKCKFFIQKSYETLMKKSFSSWKKDKMAEIRQETEKPLRNEIRDIKQQHAQEMTELTERFTLTENNLKKEMAEKDERHAQEMTELKERFTLTENDLKKETADMKQQHAQVVTELTERFTLTENDLKKETADMKQQHAQVVTELTERFTLTVNNLNKEMDEKDERHAQEVNALKEKSTLTENNLKKDMDTLKCLMMDTLIKSKDIKQEETGASSAHDSPLIKELKACKDSETLRNIFSSVVDEFNKKLEASKVTESRLRDMYASMLDDYIRRENQLKTDNRELNKKLEASKETERCLRDMYASMVDDYIRRESQYKTDIEKLQKEIKNVMAKEKHQEQKPGEAEDGDTHHIKQLETDFTRKETDLDNSSALTSPALSEDKVSPLDQREGDSQASGSSESGHSKPVRRNSLDRTRPNMSEGKEKLLDEGDAEMKSSPEHSQSSGMSESGDTHLYDKTAKTSLEKKRIHTKNLV
ncbi:uncharacterized protein LOC127628797 [Xyrauchen texanus]|uniref:uncharacterized protein LOC127628797 n=1 Tax=Xyrauchen texanus TaxID=154827 RepID=UPI002242819E|nr:uncharacterized protein LOC127628797 [Xyrauchen texanus]